MIPIEYTKDFLSLEGIHTTRDLEEWIRKRTPEKQNKQTKIELEAFEAFAQGVLSEPSPEYSFVPNESLQKNAKASMCVRTVENWSSIQRHHRFDKDTFDPDRFLVDMVASSPKMVDLFENIKRLDDHDLKKDGKVYKHFIFSDIKSGGYGAKIIASAFVANGFSHCFTKKLQVVTPRANAMRKTFGVLSSTAIYNTTFTQRNVKSVTDMYNARPANVYGENMRFIILDSGFKEGIDLFDVKYVHIFEKQTSEASFVQAVGRATRTCGQKGLYFEPNVGWKLHVYQYFLTHLNHKPVFNDYLAYAGVDLNMQALSTNIEKLAMVSAVDFDLNMEIHKSASATTKGPQDVVESPRLTEETKEDIMVDLNTNIRDLPFEDFMKRINLMYKEYKYKPTKIENLCEPQITNGSKFVQYTESQKFITNYFTPNHFAKGLLVWHSVGTGKTCAAVSIKSFLFERMNYSIVWVTRRTLKSDIWKNMYVDICDHIIKEKHKEDDTVDILKKHMSKRFLPPMSYKQFSNMLKGKNEFYQKLVELNGKEDILKNTLIIIDEAHKLYSNDLPPLEKPDIPVIESAISKSKSCKVVLMTATPIAHHPMELIKLFNLVLHEKLPSKLDEFKKMFIENNMFTEKGKEEFQNKIKGLVSYLNRRFDARQFTQPIFYMRPVTISSYDAEKESCAKKYDQHTRECAALDESTRSLRKKLAKDISSLIHKQIRFTEYLLDFKKKMEDVLGKKIILPRMYTEKMPREVLGGGSGVTSDSHQQQEHKVIANQSYIDRLIAILFKNEGLSRFGKQMVYNVRAMYILKRLKMISNKKQRMDENLTRLRRQANAIRKRIEECREFAVKNKKLCDEAVEKNKDMFQVAKITKC